MKIGFIGLGKMGSGIAQSLLRAGHELTVWNRSHDALAPLVENGARAGKSPEDTVHGDCLFSMLASDEAMHQVGLDGRLLDSAPRGFIHVNCATISVAFARELATAHAQRGISYVAAPVFGRPNVAEAGELTVVVAGPSDATEKMRPAFDAFGKRVTVLGEDAPAANLFKIAGNFLIISAIETLSEAFVLLAKGGVDPKPFHEVMSSTLFAAPVYQGYGAAILVEKFDPPGFALKLGKKDTGLALDAANALGVPLPIAELANRSFDQAIAEGLGDKDWAAVSRVVAENAGLQSLAPRPDAAS
ncbi:MAG TPA: NAD(P)-dependent oxidoreductase [Rhizomicrobium sp.]|jgi:3-hydroxyisobutyrate dehydrogenase-like beta-hydroxyacid dehydrogenase